MVTRIEILEIQIEGFRAIREPLRLSLEHPKEGTLGRVVLAGPNGSGKTSVLEAILIALGREALIVRDLPVAARGDRWRVEIPPGGQIQLRCKQIGSGELELVTMAGTLLLADFDGLLLIDEPELHLHREWHTKLLDVLKAMAPDAQLFVATHADAPWDQAYSFERFFLAGRGDPRAQTPA